jgi:diguanylate cyclase
VLKQFVSLVQHVARRDDRLYRMGGEEFALYLPHTGDVGLLAFLDRLQTHLRSRLAGPGGPVTVSIGAAVVQQGDSDWPDWLARADQAMYRAKKIASPACPHADSRSRAKRRSAN